MLRPVTHTESAPMLLRVSEQLVPGDSKTIRSYPFEVPRGAQGLFVHIAWSPRHSDDEAGNRQAVRQAVATWLGIDEDEAEAEVPGEIERYLARIPNLLNVVFVDPAGTWRGRTDRGRGGARPLVWTEDAPPLGFAPGPLTPGTWRAELEVHAVVPPHCEVTLEVSLCAPDAADEDVAREQATDQQRPQGGPGWYRGELHSHSVHSDGGYPVAKLVQRAEDLGLDFLSLTDHNTMAGLQELATSGFAGVPGVELTTFHGHHVVVGARELVPWHEDGARVDVNTVAARYREQGALFALSHPFSVGDPVCTGCRWDSPELDPEHIDLIEVWYRQWRGERTDNEAAYALWNDLWRQGYRPTAVGVRDWHTKEHEAALPGPLPTTAVWSESLESDDLIEGLRRGAAYMTSGPSVEFSLHTGAGDVLPLGARVPTVDGPVVATIDLSDLGLPESDAPSTLSLFRCGETIATVEVHQAGRFQLTDPKGGPAWYRAELWRGPKPLAITNHIELCA